MNVPRDAGSFIFDGPFAFEPRQLLLDLSFLNITNSGHHYPQHKKDCRRDEPPRLPKVRHYREIQRRAALIPASFAVECPDLKAIFPGRQTRVFGVPFRASILPILVETLKAVAKT